MNVAGTIYNTSILTKYIIYVGMYFIKSSVLRIDVIVTFPKYIMTYYYIHFLDVIAVNSITSHNSYPRETDCYQRNYVCIWRPLHILLELRGCVYLYRTVLKLYYRPGVSIVVENIEKRTDFRLVNSKFWFKSYRYRLMTATRVDHCAVVKVFSEKRVFWTSEFHVHGI